MKHLALLAVTVACSSPAFAVVTLFADSTAFHAAAPGAVLIENFEDSLPGLRDAQLPGYTGPTAQISFTPVTGTPPNVVVASAGYTNFGAGNNPTTSIILTASGNEDFIGTLTSAATAFGFDVLLNDSPLTISFFNGVTLLGTLNFDTPPVAGANMGFAGITSDLGVTSFRLTASNGENVNTGVDNIYAGPIGGAVPEPQSWMLMLSGFGVIGMTLRRPRRSKRTLAKA